MATQPDTNTQSTTVSTSAKKGQQYVGYIAEVLQLKLDSGDPIGSKSHKFEELLSFLTKDVYGMINAASKKRWEEFEK
jgi:hypothetical protein